MSKRFVRRFGYEDAAGRSFVVVGDDMLPRDINARLAEAGSALRLPERDPHFARSLGFWDIEMNDICTDEEAARRQHEPVPDRFARIMPTETKPSRGVEAPREKEEERKNHGE